jgi:hypothetical protein
MKDRGAAGKSLAEKNKRITKLLSALEGKEMSIPDVTSLLGVVPKTARNLVAELKLAGQVDFDGQTVRLLKAQEPAQEAQGAAIFPGLDETIGRLPADAHKSFFRLLLAVAVGRFHLSTTIKDGWPAGIVYGPTGSFKTAWGIMVAGIFGLKDEAVVRVIGRETSRSLLGRRVAAGKGTMSFKPSEYLAGPLMVLDEADKTGQELRQDLLLLLQGDSVLELEGVRFTAKSTPLLTFNADRIPGWLHPAYLRRSFVLDTTKDFDRRAVARAALAVFAGLPRLSLGTLRPPIRSIPDDLVAELDEHVGRFLTAGSAAIWDARYISKAALGYVSLGRMPLRRALLLVGKDYLVTAATMGRTRGDFAGYFDHLLAGLPAESLPAVVEPDEPEDEEPGYSLNDLCECCLQGYANGIISGTKQGKDDLSNILIQGKWPIQMRGNGITDIKKPEPDYVLCKVLHILSMTQDMAQKKRFDENTMKTVFSKAETQGWYAGKNMGWNRDLICLQNQTYDSSCSNTWWKHCTSCKQRQKYLDWQNKRLSSGKKVVQMQKRGDTWER